MAVIDQEITQRYALYNGDSNEVLPLLPDSSIDFSIYSPPFATKNGALYHYSSSDRDLSNARDYDEFFEQYDFIVAEINRLTKPGRLTAVHCMDVPTGNTGKDGFTDFPGDLIRAHTRCRNEKCKASERMRLNGICGHGWFEFIARYAVWKEPLAVRNRLMIKSLAHKTIVDDSSKCSVASADYLLVFRRRGKNAVPIAHPHGLTEYAGEREIPKDLLRYKNWQGSQLENKYSHWIWRQYASAFWDDVRMNRILPYREARDAEDEKHVHPLQLDVIDRALVLWSNPDDVVLTPFLGVGSEAYAAVRNGRRAIGIELKPSYFRQAKRNVAEALIERREGAESLEFEFEGDDKEATLEQFLAMESEQEIVEPEPIEAEPEMLTPEPKPEKPKKERKAKAAKTKPQTFVENPSLLSEMMDL